MKRNYNIVALLFLMFFVISFVTNILGALNPVLIKSFTLSLTRSAVVPFTFFMAFGIVSVPAGFFVKKYKEKRIMQGAIIICACAAVLFLFYPIYPVFLIFMFISGGCMAILQVVISPLLKAAGGEENFPFNSVMAQLLSRGAAFLAPAVLTYCVTGINQNNSFNRLFNMIPAGMAWISFYLVVLLILLFTGLMIMVSDFPAAKNSFNPGTGSLYEYKTLFRDRTDILYFSLIFAYAGAEQGVAYWISKFLFTYHNYEPVSVGSSIVGWYWGMMAAGCLTGLGLMKIINSRKALTGSVLAAAVFLAIALFGDSNVVLIAFPMVGFSFSVMWSVIFSLSFNSIEGFNRSFCGVFCLALTGGAFIQLFVGWLGDMFGLRTGMSFVYISLAYIFVTGLRSSLVAANETFKLKKHFF